MRRLADSLALADAVSGGRNSVAEEGQFAAEDSVEIGFVGRVDGDEALAFLLIELLFFEHADFVVCGVHAPIFDIDVEFGQVEIRVNGVAVEDSVSLVVAVCDVVGGEPVGDEAFAVGLDEPASLGGDGFA